MSYKIQESHTHSPSGVPVFTAHPVERGLYPCFVVLHERYGLVEHTLNLAKRFASEGYSVIAPNLFYDFEDQEALREGRTPGSPRIADDRALEILDDVVTIYDGLEGANFDRLGMLGACATGRYPVLWGAHRRLDACVVLHGLYANREWAADEALRREPLVDLVRRMEAEFLGLFGELDDLISVDDVRFIRNNFEDCNKSYQITLYGEAPHGWMNSTRPANYRPKATEESWVELFNFLERTLQNEVAKDLTRWRFSSTKSAD